MRFSNFSAVEESAGRVVSSAKSDNVACHYGTNCHKVTKNVSLRRDSLDAELLDSIAQLAKRQAE